MSILALKTRLEILLFHYDTAVIMQYAKQQKSLSGYSPVINPKHAWYDLAWVLSASFFSRPHTVPEEAEEDWKPTQEEAVDYLCKVKQEVELLKTLMETSRFDIETQRIELLCTLQRRSADVRSVVSFHQEQGLSVLFDS